METLLNYLMNASAGIALFYVVYWLFLRNETFHAANRWFLIAALLLAISLPLVPLKYEVLVAASSEKPAIQTIADTFKNMPVFAENKEATDSFNWRQALLLVYLTGVAIFLVRLLAQTFVLIRLMIKYRVQSFNGVRIVENEKYGLPFSFFNIVFINPKFHTQDDLPEILAHEKVHIRENHWFDLLFIELLTVIFWFNPFIWFFERSIKQNHEYLADKGILAQGHTVARYQALLVNQLMGMQIIGITNNLNFALSTNRLKMMTKKKTSRIRGVRFTWALPVLALLMFAFAEPKYKSKMPAQNKKAETQEIEWKNPVKMRGVVFDENNKPLPGTSVVIKGTTIGTVCDMDGKFELEVPENGVIVLSFVGKKTLEDTFSGITSGYKTEDVFNRKYQLADAVVYIGSYEPPAHSKKMIKSEGKLVPPPPPPPPPVSEKEEKEVFFIVEDMPQFPGGADALQVYYQNLALKYNLKGEAQIGFTVNEKGEVSEIKIVKSDSEKIGKAAAGIIAKLPRWKPGSQRGKAVPVKFLMQVEFK